MDDSKLTLWDAVALASMAVATLLPLGGGFLIGYVVVDLCGDWDASKAIYVRPLGSLSLENVVSLFRPYVIFFFFVGLGAVSGVKFMYVVEKLFQRIESRSRERTKKNAAPS